MQAKTKNGPVPRAVVEAFYRALADRDVGTLATYLDDDVVWTISGPVDILPFCGQRVGKDRDEYLKKQAEAQFAVKETTLVEAVRSLLAKHKLG